MFTLCVGIGPRQTGTLDGPDDLERAASRWDRLGLEQIVAGECDLAEHPGRRRVAEIGTSAEDEPLLGDLLGLAAESARHEWLLLVSGDAVLSQALVTNLAQLCRPGCPKRLVIGRAWRLERQWLQSLDEAVDPDGALAEAIDRHGRLFAAEPPDPDTEADADACGDWVLLPRGALLEPPASLSCDPQQALPWLIQAARLLGWPVLEATAAAPLVRPAAAPLVRLAEANQDSAGAWRSWGSRGAPGDATGASEASWGAARRGGVPAAARASGVVLPHEPGTPRLSLLLAAPERELERLAAALRPAPSLPWEVVARPAEPAGDPTAVTAAWRSGLLAARGELAWPVIDPPPPLALIPVVLRSCEQPGADLLLLSWLLDGLPMPPRLSWHQQPGCLVAQTGWLRRAGGFSDAIPAADALLQLRRRAEARGARSRALPISAWAAPSVSPSASPSVAAA